MGARISLRDVAREAGVSVSTASLALSGSVRIATATSERVRAAAATLGYVRDLGQAVAAAGRFRHAGKTALIAAWVEDARRLRRLRDEAAGMGMAVHAIEARQDSVRAVLAQLGAAALVVQQRGLERGLFSGVAMPVVLWGDEGEGDSEADLVECCEWWTASMQAVARVRAAGYRRPVAVLTPASPGHWHDQVRSAAMRAAGTPTLEWDGSAEALRGFIARRRPDAVVGGNIHVLRMLQEIGQRLPFAALLTHDTPWHRHCAGWREDHPRRVRMTLELIEQRLRYGPCPPCRIIVAPHWWAGSSLPLAVT